MHWSSRLPASCARRLWFLPNPSVNTSAATLEHIIAFWQWTWSHLISSFCHVWQTWERRMNKSQQCIDRTKIGNITAVHEPPPHTHFAPTNPMCTNSREMTVLNKGEAMQAGPKWGRVLSHWARQRWPWSPDWLSVQCDTNGGQQVRQARLLFRKRVQSHLKGSTDLATFLATLPISTRSINSNLLS